MGLDRLVTMGPRVYGIVLVTLCGLAGCNQTPGTSASSQVLASSPAAPYADPPTPPPSLVKSEGKAYATTGPLVVEQQADVVAQRDGRITSVKVEIGDHVRAGQVLALLDNRALEAARAQKAAKLDSLRAQVQAWEAEQKSNQADLHRADAMRAEKILDEEDWEHAKYKLTETTSQVARYKAEQIAADADLKAAEVDLSQARVLAPFDGVVGRRSVHEAQTVKKGDMLFWVTAQAPLRVVFTVPESVMAYFPLGAKLELGTADYPLLKQTAHVFRVSPVVDPASGSLEVIGSLEKPSPLLKPGMSMQVRLSPQ
jgi:HlyD family secretion protein